MLEALLRSKIFLSNRQMCSNNFEILPEMYTLFTTDMHKAQAASGCNNDDFDEAVTLTNDM